VHVPASPSIASSRSARRQTDKWQNLRVVAARGTQGTSIPSLMRNLGISILVATLAENAQVVHSRLVEGLRLNNPLAQAPFLAAPFTGKAVGDCATRQLQEQ